MAPIALPSTSRKADAFSVVGMIAPEALRGFNLALRVTPYQVASRLLQRHGDGIADRMMRVEETGGMISQLGKALSLVLFDLQLLR